VVQSDNATEPYAKAAGCIIEYVGKLACMAGYRKERIRAREYLQCAPAPPRRRRRSPLLACKSTVR
jgi:hypothetical protein